MERIFLKPGEEDDCYERSIQCGRDICEKRVYAWQDAAASDEKRLQGRSEERL